MLYHMKNSEGGKANVCECKTSREVKFISFSQRKSGSSQKPSPLSFFWFESVHGHYADLGTRVHGTSIFTFLIFSLVVLYMNFDSWDF